MTMMVPLPPLVNSAPAVALTNVANLPAGEAVGGVQGSGLFLYHRLLLPHVSVGQPLGPALLRVLLAVKTCGYFVLKLSLER